MEPGATDAEDSYCLRRVVGIFWEEMLFDGSIVLAYRGGTHVLAPEDDRCGANTTFVDQS